MAPEGPHSYSGVDPGYYFFWIFCRIPGFGGFIYIEAYARSSGIIEGAYALHGNEGAFRDLDHTM